MWILMLTMFVNGVVYEQYIQANRFEFVDKEACELVMVEEQARFEQYMKDYPPPPEVGVITGKITCEPAPKDTSTPDPRGHS